MALALNTQYKFIWVWDPSQRQVTLKRFHKMYNFRAYDGASAEPPPFKHLEGSILYMKL